MSFPEQQACKLSQLRFTEDVFCCIKAIFLINKRQRGANDLELLLKATISNSEKLVSIEVSL